MLKVALVAAAVTAASMAHGGDVDAAARTPRTPPAACHPGQALEPVCALRGVNDTASAAEPPVFALPASSPDWAPLPPAHGGLDFKDAAANPQPAPAALEGPGPPTILSALLALGALVLLLRKRPT